MLNVVDAVIKSKLQSTLMPSIFIFGCELLLLLSLLLILRELDEDELNWNLHGDDEAVEDDAHDD